MCSIRSLSEFQVVTTCASALRGGAGSQSQLQVLGVALLALASQCQGATPQCGGGQAVASFSPMSMPCSPYHQPEPNGWLAGLLPAIAVLIFIALVFTCGFSAGFIVGRVRADDSKLASSTRTVAVQSQCKYTWWTNHPRFTPLPEHSHGVF